MKQVAANVGVIGPRGSGKTTYLASLAYYSRGTFRNVNRSAFKVEASEDFEDNQRIIEQAKNKLLKGATFSPTLVTPGGVDDLANLTFRIERKKKIGFGKEIINLLAVDYPGEIFDELVTREFNPMHEDFMDRILRADVVGLLVLLPAWEQDSDDYYSQMMRSFISEIDRRGRLLNLRLAVAISKCERGEIWTGRFDPELDLFQVYLPETTFLLKNRIPKKNLGFYAVSAFGVLGRNDPRPNRIDESGFLKQNSIMRNPKVWEPFNLLSPLYWLSTGKHLGCYV